MAVKRMPILPKRDIWHRLQRLLVVFQVGLAVLLATALGVGLGGYWAVARTLPADPNLDEFIPTLATKILTWDGQALATIYVEDRDFTPLLEIPKNLQHAVVAVEDRRFFRHRGVDIVGIMRALKADLQQRRMVQGASTLTQQLARDLYLSRKKTLARKAQEALLAMEIERRYSKAEILELYLNQVHFGHATYGVASAARAFFGRKPQDLSLAECALLAGVIRRPAYYSPYSNPKVALGRRNYVLQRMRDEGYVSAGQCREAVAQPLGVEPQVEHALHTMRAPYFTDYVVRQLEARYGHERTFRGGLRVYTTLDLKVQQAAEQAVKDQAKRLRGQRAEQGALLCLETNSGQILAMVGGLDYWQSQWNRAVQAKRQPGSAFKPFVYTTAIDLGMSPSNSIDARRRQFGNWSPQNANRKEYGSLTLRSALVNSVNTATVNLAYRIGMDRVIRTARAMGIRQPLQPYLSTAIGSGEVTLLELTAAFACFATDGIYYEPMAIIRVEDFRGGLIEEFYPKPRRALRPSTAETMRDMLQDVIRYGTGTRAQGVHPEAGGKTGTTDDYRDVWFMGFTPRLTAGVWAGNDDHSATAHLFGGTACAPTWREFIKAALPLVQSRPEPKRGPTGAEDWGRAPGEKPTLRGLPPAEEPKQEATPEEAQPAAGEGGGAGSASGGKGAGGYKEDRPEYHGLVPVPSEKPSPAKPSPANQPAGGGGGSGKAQGGP
jgi:penicillin-binding protein 1A